MGNRFKNTYFTRDNKENSKFDRGRMNKQKDDNRKNSDDNFQWQKLSKNFLFWLLIIIITIWVSTRVSQVGNTDVVITFKQFKYYNLLNI